MGAGGGQEACGRWVQVGVGSAGGEEVGGLVQQECVIQWWLRVSELTTS